MKTKSLLLRIFVTLVCAPLLFSCSKSSDQITDNGNPAFDLNAALAMISEQNMQSSVNYLAADAREGRRTGSRGYDEAAQYVVMGDSTEVYSRRGTHCLSHSDG